MALSYNSQQEFFISGRWSIVLPVVVVIGKVWGSDCLTCAEKLWLAEFWQSWSLGTPLTTFGPNYCRLLVVFVWYPKAETFRWGSGVSRRLANTVKIGCRVFVHISHEPLRVRFSGSVSEWSAFVIVHKACSHIIAWLHSVIFQMLEPRSFWHREAKNRLLHSCCALVFVDF